LHCLLRRYPLPELLRRHDLQGEQHAAVIQAAEFGAAASERARLDWRDLEVIRMIGQDVALELERDNPE
jgi:hypothetical protein